VSTGTLHTDFTVILCVNHPCQVQVEVVLQLTASSSSCRAPFAAGDQMLYFFE
jgi:hypothetical protein